MKHSYIILTVIFGTILIAFFLAKDTPSITGKVVTDPQGCCLDICASGYIEGCQQYTSNECSSVPECNVGCCIDDEGYCLDNVLEGRCIASNYNFIKQKTCDQEFRCIAGQQGSMSYYGYANVLGRDKGVIYAEPQTGTKEDLFYITALFFDTENTPETINVRASHGAYEREIDLTRYDPITYEPIPHEGVYSGIWNSNTLPTHDSQQLYEVTFSTTNLLENQLSGNILVSSTPCYPIFNNLVDFDSHENIIFLADPSMDSEKVTNAIMNTIFTYSLLQDDDVPQFHTVEGYISDVAHECSFYNESRDYIIHLTDTDMGCEFSDTLAELSINFTFPRSIQQISMRNICDYVLFPLELQQSLISMFTPPEIIIQEPSAGSILTSPFEMRFIITTSRSDDPEFTYSIMSYDEEDYEFIILTNQGSAGMTITEQVELDPGQYDIFIEVEDDIGNIGFTEYFTITIE